MFLGECVPHLRANVTIRTPHYRRAHILSLDRLARENRSLDPVLPLPEESPGGSPLADHFEAPGPDCNIASRVPGDYLDGMSSIGQLTARVAQPVGASFVGEGSPSYPI